MMATPNLNSVESLIKGVRVLLLDKVKPYRYNDTSLVAALNLSLLEARRVRPDIFLCRYGIEVPQYEEVNGEEIPVEAQFRLAIEYGTAAHALMRDQEDVQDERSSSLMSNFYTILVGVRQSAVRGSTPSAKSGASAKNAVPPQQG